MINYFWGLQWCQQYKQCLAHKTIGVKDRIWLRLHHHLRILTRPVFKPILQEFYDTTPFIWNCISIYFENLSQRKSHSNVKKQLSALKLKEGVYFGLSTILKVFFTRIVRLERSFSSKRQFIPSKAWKRKDQAKSHRRNSWSRWKARYKRRDKEEKYKIERRSQSSRN